MKHRALRAGYITLLALSVFSTLGCGGGHSTPLVGVASPSSGASSSGFAAAPVPSGDMRVGAYTPMPKTPETYRRKGSGVRLRPNALITGFQIILTQPWTDTGIALSQGERVGINVSGTFSCGAPPPEGCTSDPNGFVCPDPNMTAPSLPCFSAIAEVGSSGVPFEVGTNLMFNAPVSGELFLGANDSYYPDNSGSWTATIIFRSPTPVASDCYLFKGAGDQPAYAGGPTINSVIASSTALQSISSYLAKNGSRYALVVQAVPGANVDPNALGLADPSTDTIYLYSNNLNSTINGGQNNFNESLPQTLYHELDHNYYFVSWPGTPATVTATLSEAPQPGGPSAPKVFLNLGGNALGGPLQHILVHNDLVNADPSLGDRVSLYEALNILSRSDPAEWNSEPFDDAKQNEMTKIPINWSPPTPPANSTCGN